MDLSIKGLKVKDRRTRARATKTPLHCQLTVSVAACPRLKIHSACYNEIIVSDDGHGWQRALAAANLVKIRGGMESLCSSILCFQHN